MTNTRKGRRLARLGLAACLLSFAAGTEAEAQQSPAAAAETPAAGPRVQAFDAADAHAAEDIQGGPLLLIAYGLIWFLVFGYVLRLARLQARAQADLSRLEEALAKRRPPGDGEDTD